MNDLDRLAHDLGTVTIRMVPKVSAATRKAGRRLVDESKGMANVDTGAMRDSIGADYLLGGLAVEAGPTVKYSPFVHWGTSRYPGNPYMTRALSKVAPEYEADLTDIAGRVLG